MALTDWQGPVLSVYDIATAQWSVVEAHAPAGAFPFSEQSAGGLDVAGTGGSSGTIFTWQADGTFTGRQVVADGYTLTGDSNLNSYDGQGIFYIDGATGGVASVIESDGTVSASTDTIPVDPPGQFQADKQLVTENYVVVHTADPDTGAPGPSYVFERKAPPPAAAPRTNLRAGNRYSAGFFTRTA